MRNLRELAERSSGLKRRCPSAGGSLAYLKINPIMDPPHGQPRFDALVAKMGLSTRA